MRNFFVGLFFLVLGWGIANAATTHNTTVTSPTSGQISSSDSSMSGGQSAQAPVDLNSADVNTLMNLQGIGQVKAQSIIDYRQQHGAFKNVADLGNVKGFGAKTLAKIEKNNPDRLMVK